MIPIKLNWGGKTVETEALVDSGAEGVFINKDMITRYGLKQFPLARPITARNADNSINRAGSISTYALQRIVIGDKSRMERLLVTDIGKTPVILGLPWLTKMNPKIDWQNKTLLINQLTHAPVLKENPLTAPWTFRAYFELNQECTIRRTTLATKLAQDQIPQNTRPHKIGRAHV